MKGSSAPRFRRRRRAARAAGAVAGLLLWLCHAVALAHETRPAYLELGVAADDRVEVLWRQPLAGEYALALRPVLSSGWLQHEPARTWTTADSLTRVWEIPAGGVALAGQHLRIEGLEGTLTDVLVRLRRADGREWSRVLRPTSPSLVLPGLGAQQGVLVAGVRLGFTHIFSGPDHLLYLLALLLLVEGGRRLLAAITAFTAAHSLTLGAAAFDLVRLEPATVEVAIALSILYVAAELVRRARGERTAGQRRPWIAAFAFGLLHGFGFAGALRALELPREALLPALLSFNLGIEAGQLVFAAAVLGLLTAASRIAPALRAGLLRAAPHAIGALAAFWLVERMLLLDPMR